MTAKNGYEIHQELAERRLNAARSQRLTVYYPRMTQTDIEIVAKEVTVEMKTNTGIREILDRFFRSAAPGVFQNGPTPSKPHDTLWSIALYNLGDGQKYKDIAALNGIPIALHHQAWPDPGSRVRYGFASPDEPADRDQLHPSPAGSGVSWAIDFSPQSGDRYECRIRI
ncbi:MAG: hypothetical protein LRY35_03315 [Clostridiales bacterium]|nr:hypothetical protein [Clostridiales bacterium]